MSMRNLYDTTTPIPHDVVEAAMKVRRWVESNVPDLKEVNICSVGTRTFLEVVTMLSDRRPTVFYTELREPPDAAIDSAQAAGDMP